MLRTVDVFVAASCVLIAAVCVRRLLCPLPPPPADGVRRGDVLVGVGELAVWVPLRLPLLSVAPFLLPRLAVGGFDNAPREIAQSIGAHVHSFYDKN